MGTHATTTVIDHNEPVVNMYRHYDGYTDAHGIELAKWLSGFTLVNGLPFGEDKSSMANGMDDLAALMVAHFKKESGGFYLVHLDREEEYHYTVYQHLDGSIRLRVIHNGTKVFDGTPTDFIAQKISV